VTSVLWRCWLGGRKGTRPIKTEWWGVGVVICLERVADLHMAQLMLLPLTVSCFSKIQIGFTFLVPAYPGGPGQMAVKRLCVYVGLLGFKCYILQSAFRCSLLAVHTICEKFNCGINYTCLDKISDLVKLTYSFWEKNVKILRNLKT